MTQPLTPAVTSRRDVYVACPDLSSFRASHPRPLRGVWRTVNNDFGSYKRKQRQILKRKRHGEPMSLPLSPMRRLTCTLVSSRCAGTMPLQRPPLRQHLLLRAFLRRHQRRQTLRRATEPPRPPIVPSERRLGTPASHGPTGHHKTALPSISARATSLTDRQWLDRVVKLMETSGRP